MKDLSEFVTPEFNANEQCTQITLKALAQFFIGLQLESREIDIQGLLKPPHRAKDNETLHFWRTEESPHPTLHGKPRSSSTDGRVDRIPLTKYWRRQSLKKTPKPKGFVGPSPKEDCILHQDSHDQNMSLQQQLAITALNLTAPASSTALRNHRNSWVQLSGHPGSLSPAGPGTIWKKQPGDTNETWVYEALMTDSACDIVPKFYREIVYEGEKFIEISDLLYNFNCPAMMDIKIGSRTFLESEVSNSKARNDLYKKMMKLDPSYPTAEEHQEKAITKLRYMNFRDNMSSSRNLGFRIEALKMPTSSSVTELKKIRTKEEVVGELTSFIQRREFVKKQILRRLKLIRDTFENSLFFKTHEVIGSSILIVYDESNVGAWIIDFAKTCKLPSGVDIDHRTDWKEGNHEEGYLTGLENLIQCFEEVPVPAAKTRKLKFFHKS